MRLCCRLVTAAVLLAAATAVAAPVPLLHHRARVTCDPASHRFTLRDTLEVPAGVDTLRLNRSLAYSLCRLDGKVLSTGLSIPPARPAAAAPPDSVLLAVPVPAPATLLLAATGRWHQATAGVVFSRERVGGEIRGTVGEEGIYLSAAAGWLPLADGTMATHRLTVVTPAGWEPVTQGRRVVHAAAGDSQVTVWDAVHPSDGLTLIANRYVVSERRVGDVTTYTFFLADAPRLAATYQERTAAYLDMYGRMIGPYPYAKFATVENWFPTGYGFPSWTLLGGQVLRLPFIPYTSFGHEICHDWWGNSAFVGKGGNWCEGLTVYCADYHYKELESPAAAREYRRNLLKDYLAYVRDGRDFPLREFTARHSGATRAVGYGKAMMVFHMADRRLGRAAFLDALREVWREHLFQPVTWDDFLAAFAARGEGDWQAFGRQWLDRPGAPHLRVTARRRNEHVRLTLSQDSPLYDLRVPVTVTTAAGDTELILPLAAAARTWDLTLPGAVRLAVDPDDHLFRRLDPEEVEPTVSQVLGDPAPRFVLPPGDAAATAFADDWVEAGKPVTVTPGEDPAGHARILVAPAGAVAARFLPPNVTAAGSLLFLEGRRVDLKNAAVVLAVADPDLPGVADLLVLTHRPAALSGLAGRVSHYGKYSWLVFPRRGRPEKGNWPVTASPLTVDLTRGDQE